MLINAWRRLLSYLKRGNPYRTSHTISRRKPRPLFLERLEDRVVPSVNAWINPLGGSWNDPTNWSNGALPTAGDDVVINLPSAVTVRLAAGSTSVNSLQVNDSLVLDGGSLTVTGDVANAGAIHLVSTNPNADAALVVDGTLTNGVTGLVSVEAGAGGGRRIVGDWINQGTVDVQGGTGLNLGGTGASGPDFTQAGGAFTIESGAWVVQDNGRLHYTGGALSGEYVVYNSELDIRDTVTAASVIEVRGQSNILDENASPTVTLWVQGCNWNGDGVLTAADGAVNAGTIDLESIGFWWWNSDLRVVPGGTFTNTGVLDVRAGSGGGRHVVGDWVNDGTVDVQAGAGLNLWGTDASGPRFTQAGGSLTAEDGGWVLQSGGLFHYTGGTLDGEIVVLGTELDIEDTVTATAVLKVRGRGNVLDDNLAPGVTLWVQGSGYDGDAVLTAGDGAINAGVIDLESIQDDWNTDLEIADGGTLTNAPTGVITVNRGSGGGRRIDGDLDNQGALTADAAMQWSGSVTNSGTIDVAAGVGMELAGGNGTSPTLSQTGGSLTVDGSLLLRGGMLDFEGGAITGSFTVDGSQIYVDPGVTDPSVIRVVGTGNLLLDNGSATTTLLVQGDDAFNGGVLTVAPDATNAGTIQLDSASGYWGSALVMQDMLDNLPGGSILVTHGAGGGRWIVGDLDNEGLLSVAADAPVEIDGATDAGPTLIQDGGLIQADGRLVLHGGLFDFESGDVAGHFLVNNSQIYVGPSAADPATVYVVGSGNTLLGNEGPSVTLQVQGDDAFGPGVLTAAAGAVNAGAIVLDSTSSYWGSVLAAPDTLLNASGGLIAVADDGGGGVRSLAGDFINAGVIYVPPDKQLSLDDATNAGPTLIQAGGLIAAAGQFVQHGGLFDFESGGVLGAFLVNNAQIYVGPEVVTPNTIEVVGPGNTLLDNASAATTLWVQGNDGFNAGVLTAVPGAFNAGTIVLASASAYWGETLASGAGFTNLAGGHVAVYGGGLAALMGTLTNDGYLSLSGVGSMSIDTLVNHGTVGVDATGVSVAPGLAALGDVVAAETDAASRLLSGASGTDAGSGGSAPTAPVAAGGEAAAGRNAGSLGLQTETSPGDGSSGGAPTTPVVYLTRLTVGSWTNDGTVAVDPGTQLEVASDGSGCDTFTQAGGLVAADGSVIVDGGLFHFTGGGLMGDFTVRDGWIRVEATVSQPSTIDVVGHENVLLDNASSSVTLRVQGGSPLGDGDAVLTAADASTNLGVIVLESLDGAHLGYLRVPQGRFTNGASGVIQVDLPRPGASSGGGASDDTGAGGGAAALGNVGAGSVPAGELEGDGGGVTDTTGLPVLPGLQADLDAVQAAEVNGDGNLGSSFIDSPTAMGAMMALTPGVADGLLAVEDLGGDYLTGAGAAEAFLAAAGGPGPFAAGVLANEGQVFFAFGTGAGLASAGPTVETLSQARPGLGTTGWEAGWLQGMGDGQVPRAVAPAPASGGGGSGSGGPSDGGPDGAGGLIDELNHFAQDLNSSAQTPLSTANNILNGLTGGWWGADVLPAVQQAWQAAQPYVQQYGLPAVGAGGVFVQQYIEPVVHNVVAPYLGSALQRAEGLVLGIPQLVAAIPTGVAEAGSLFHDGWAAAQAEASWLLGGQSYKPEFWSSFAHGLQQAQTDGTIASYLGNTLNQALNAATLGLTGTIEALGPALAQMEQTGDLSPLASWLGGATVDALTNPLASGLVGLAWEAWNGLTSEGRLGAVDGAWSAEATAETRLGEAEAGAAAETEAGAEAGLTEAVEAGEATAEETAAGGDAADAGQLAQAEVGAAEAEAAAREGLGSDASAGARASAVDAAAAEVQQAEQDCLAQQGSPGGCFAAGIPLLTSDGGKPIETFKENDRLLSRNESDPNGPPIIGTVEKVFARVAAILELRLEGQVVGTTAEHLFWVEAKRAWTAAGEIRPGDRLLSHDGRWVAVEALEHTGRVETVYNLRVSGSHTYFVGGLSWGFAVWAHNAYDASEFAANEAAYNTWRNAGGLPDTPALRELYLNATLRGDMSTTLPNGEKFTATAGGGPEGLYQVVKGQFDGVRVNMDLVRDAYGTLADLARQQRLASAPTIPDDAAVLKTMMDYDATSQTGGNPRDFNNGTNLVDVVGSPQAPTAATPNHVPSILFEAAEQARLPDTEAIYIDRSLSSIITGPDFAPDIEPDIVRKINDTTYEITEIRSTWQTETELEEKLERVVQQVAAYNEANGTNIQVTPKVMNADYTPEMLQAALGQ